ncbi:MAG: hypothetical protein XD95_0023 [Microgenomates bacterium 39_7]|nr:MAG: hypothetical protein XD95_0023 [Microgenomates bacterium 39_7]
MLSTTLSSPLPNTSLLSTDLMKKYSQLMDKLAEKNKEAHDWLCSTFPDQSELADFTKQFMTAVTFAAQVAVTVPVEAQVQQNLSAMEEKQRNKLLKEITEQELEEIMSKMVGYVNMEVGHLPKEEELYLEQQLSDLLGFEVVAELEGNRLNHSIGIMGGEQHLMRYPGDKLSEHDTFLEAGISPQRGAFGWFTEDGELTEKSIMMEKYYFAVQTLYLPDWNTRHSELKPWYKFRKMIAVNPAEGVAVVGVVGDAGPAMWVKKQFGGSPEVIREAKIWSPQSRGRVILFFVDDSEDEVPLGIIDLKEVIHNLGEI